MAYNVQIEMGKMLKKKDNLQTRSYSS